MALFSMPAAVEALDDLLDHERQMILAGKIDALLRMGPEKERLMARLPRSVLDPDALVRLRKKAERNQDLLLAAARGIKAASKRIEAMKGQRASMRTYARDGASTDLGGGKPGFNKRA